MAEAAGRWAVRMAARLWWAPLVAVGLLTDRGSRRRWFFTPAIVAITALASTLGKLAIRRPRPGSRRGRASWGDLGAAGFPSTHTACAFAVAGWMRGSRRRGSLHAIAVLIGCWRVRCRAHHRGDVAAGALLGYGLAWQIEKLWGRVRSGAEGPPAAAPAPVISPTPSRPPHAGSLRPRSRALSRPRRPAVRP